MKTRKFCPRCGRPVLKSCTKEYDFQCFVCGEDFYRFEVLGTRNIERVRAIRRSERSEVRGIIISRALLEEYGYNGDLPTSAQMRIIADELLEYWGLSNGFRDALSCTMSNMFPMKPNK